VPKLNALQRLDHEDQLMSLIARCLIPEHPHRDRMAHVTLRQAAALDDDRLVGLTDRLTSWVAEAEAEQMSSALPAPAEVG
jgi:hypothetical protein